jgi:hypothetical protein
MPMPTPSPTTPTAIVPALPSDAILPETAPTIAAAGSVNSHATTIRPAIRQRTGASRRPTPEPTIPPEHTCVVDSGKPSRDEIRMTSAELVCAAKPCGPSMSVRPLPRVWVMRQPPR